MSFEKLWGIVKVALPAALVFVFMSGHAQAQRQGRLQNGQGGMCSGRQFGTSNSLGTQGFGSQLSTYGYPQGQSYSLLQQQQMNNLLQQQMLMQAQLNALQANALQGNVLQANAFQANGVQANARQINALRQYVTDQQMLGVAPDDALQSALYALQRNRR